MASSYAGLGYYPGKDPEVANRKLGAFNPHTFTVQAEPPATNFAEGKYNASLMLGAMRRDADKGKGKWYPEWGSKRGAARWGGHNPNHLEDATTIAELQSETSLTLSGMREPKQLREIDNPGYVTNDDCDRLKHFQPQGLRHATHRPDDPTGTFKDSVEKTMMYTPPLVPSSMTAVHTGKKVSDAGYNNNFAHMMGGGYQADFVATIEARDQAEYDAEEAKAAHLAQSIEKVHSSWMKTKRNKALDPVVAKPLWKMSKFSNVKSRTDHGRRAGGATYPRKSPDTQ